MAPLLGSTCEKHRQVQRDAPGAALFTHPAPPPPLARQDVRLFDGACDPPLRRHYPFRLSPAQHMVIRDCEVSAL